MFGYVDLAQKFKFETEFFRFKMLQFVDNNFYKGYMNRKLYIIEVEDGFQQNPTLKKRRVLHYPKTWENIEKT